MNSEDTLRVEHDALIQALWVGLARPARPEDLYDHCSSQRIFATSRQISEALAEMEGDGLVTQRADGSYARLAKARAYKRQAQAVAPSPPVQQVWCVKRKGVWHATPHNSTSSVKATLCGYAMVSAQPELAFEQRQPECTSCQSELARHTFL